MQMEIDVATQSRLEAANVLSPDVVAKYHAASEITARTLAILAQECVAGARVATLCAQGNAYVEGEVRNMAAGVRGRHRRARRPFQPIASSCTCPHSGPF